MEGEGHVKTFGEQPTAFGINAGAFDIVINCCHMINGACRSGDATGANAFWPAKKKLDEIGIMDVQVKQSAAQISGVSSLFAPARHFRKTPKASEQDFSIGVLIDNLLEPTPPRPEAHAHCRHKKPARRFRDLQDFPGAS